MEVEPANVQVKLTLSQLLRWGPEGTQSLYREVRTPCPRLGVVDWHQAAEEEER